MLRIGQKLPGLQKAFTSFAEHRDQRAAENAANIVKFHPAPAPQLHAQGRHFGPVPPPPPTPSAAKSTPAEQPAGSPWQVIGAFAAGCVLGATGNRVASDVDFSRDSVRK
jgi:hypothetical protein